ncbi:ABC transporter substrate-binding protein [Oscillospiraceae bacterium MB08-C2-2]|nr:ABC transporter substrate-binding protein [Oscillospiraceae bacterium MB08-C2-2]
MKKILAIVLMVSMALSFAACGGTSAPAPASEAPAAPSAQAAPEASASEAAPAESDQWGAGRKIGLAQMHYTNAFRTAETQSVINAFEAVGFEVVWNEAGNDTAKQISNVNDLLAQDIEYLLLPPKEEAGLVPALEAAKKAGVPVILLDRSANGTPGEDYVTAIRSNAQAEGQWCADWIVENFPDGANIVEIFGAPGSTTAMDRAKGFWAVVDQHKSLVKLDTQVGNNMRSEAQVVMENMLQAHGDKIDVVVTHSDEMTFGALQAIDGAGLIPGEDIKVLSIGDGSSAMLEEIIDGRVAACSECSPLLGPQALEVVEALEAGKPVEGLIWANDRFFTIDNAAEELKNAGW